jgi:hypothetical protein
MANDFAVFNHNTGTNKFSSSLQKQGTRIQSHPVVSTACNGFSSSNGTISFKGGCSTVHTMNISTLMKNTAFLLLLVFFF